MKYRVFYDSSDRLDLALLLGFRRLLFVIKKYTPLRPVYLILRVIYGSASCIAGIDISPSVEIGRGLTVYHGFGLVIHPMVRIGRDCVLRHGVTLGARDDQISDGVVAPVLGDRVDIGCTVLILGPVRIGNDVKIGAFSCVTSNVDANTTYRNKIEYAVRGL